MSLVVKAWRSPGELRLLVYVGSLKRFIVISLKGFHSYRIDGLVSESEDK